MPIYGRLVLAPMDGISDQPFRSLCRNMGSSFTITEFINSNDVKQGTPLLYQKISFTEEERPIGFQIYGSGLDQILTSANQLSQYSPDFFDLNLGCSIRRITNSGAGSNLLNHPKLISTIASTMVKHIDIPITAKIRLGIDHSSKNYLLVSHILEDCGISLISVHGRTQKDSWKDPAQWEPIAEIKQRLSIPVIGNGDVRSPQDIQLMLKLTGCDGVMIGRAAIGNPWIFSLIDKNTLSKDTILDMLYKHWNNMRDFYGFELANSLFRKHLKAYLTHQEFSPIYVKDVISDEKPMSALRRYF